MKIKKNSNLNIALRVFSIVSFSILLGYYIFGNLSIRLILLCSIVIIILTVNLIAYLNTTNRKIRYFFDSVRNDDSSLSFAGDEQNESLKGIYKSMNEVNKQIQQLKLENISQEQYFKILIEHLATGIITYNNKGHVLNVNTSAKKLLSTDVLTHLQQIERIDPKLYQAVKNIKPSEKRLVAIVSERGNVQLSLKATSFGTNENELYILSIQDIKSELDEKELESWMKLIRVLMHEIMNSITPVTSLSESLIKIFDNDGQPVGPQQITEKTIATTLHGLNVIKDQGKGLMSFVESYRKLTRVPEPDRKIFKVADLLSRIKVLYNSLENSNMVEFSVSQKDPDIVLFADQNLISQVLINLLKNALEANERNPGGIIIIDASVVDNKHTEICVIDNGPGVPAENMDEIFVPFFTTREKGSGIGLSISKQIMRVHGGNLKVRSVPNKETVFCMSFQS
ncbi:MAG TPA: ATP-binding protein [Bacteroidales bacterium]|nr:ATP-binding protein [Bacteroidales bacterium]